MVAQCIEIKKSDSAIALNAIVQSVFFAPFKINMETILLPEFPVLF